MPTDYAKPFENRKGWMCLKCRRKESGWPEDDKCLGCGHDEVVAIYFRALSYICEECFSHSIGVKTDYSVGTYEGLIEVDVDEAYRIVRKSSTVATRVARGHLVGMLHVNLVDPLHLDHVVDADKPGLVVMVPEPKNKYGVAIALADGSHRALRKLLANEEFFAHVLDPELTQRCITSDARPIANAKKPSDTPWCRHPEVCDKQGQCEHWLRHNVGCMGAHFFEQVEKERRRRGD